MYFVHTGSDQVIQRVTLQNGGKESESSDDTYGTGKYWITPHPNGTATDTSEGWISTGAVNETGDGVFTTYYAADKKKTETPIPQPRYSISTSMQTGKEFRNISTT